MLGLIQLQSGKQGCPIGQGIHRDLYAGTDAASDKCSGLIQNKHGSCRSHINDDYRRLVLPQSRYRPHHQICTGLSGIFHLNVQSGFQAGANHQAAFPGKLADRGFNGIENLRNHGGNNGSLQGIPLYAINVQ